MARVRKLGVIQGRRRGDERETARKGETTKDEIACLGEREREPTVALSLNE